MSAAVRRLCLVVDVEGYSKHSAPIQVALQDRLQTVVRASLSAAGISRWRVQRQDRGDGALLVLPAGLDEAVALTGLIQGMVTALSEDFGSPRLRLRVVITEGVVREAATGFVGRAVVQACRVGDAEPGRIELRRRPHATTVVMIADGLFTDVLGAGFGDVLGPHLFRSMAVSVKGEETILVRSRTFEPGDVIPPTTPAAARTIAVGMGSAGLILGEVPEDDDRDHTLEEVPSDEVDPRPTELDDPEPTSEDHGDEVDHAFVTDESADGPDESLT